MLSACYISGKNESPEIGRRISSALRAAHLRRFAAGKLGAGSGAKAAPDLIVAAPGENRAFISEVEGLRRAFPRSAIVIASGRVSQEMSAQAYRAGATAVVPLGALPEALTYLAQVLETGTPAARDPVLTMRDPVLTMVEEFHDRVTGRLDAGAIARGLGVSVSALAKAAGLTPSALSKRPQAKAAQSALRELEFALAGLYRLLGSDARVRAWLNAPQPDLGGEAPLGLLTDGSTREFADYVRGALSGQPT
jgi:hypothetical protein